MSHFLLSRSDLAAIAEHHFHVSLDGKRIEERWCPAAEIDADCFKELRPALLEAMQRPKKMQAERIEEITAKLSERRWLPTLTAKRRKEREALSLERKSLEDLQRARDTLMRKMASDGDRASDAQLLRYAHIFGVDIEIVMQGAELQFRGEFLEAGTEIHTVTESMGEIDLCSYKVSHYRIDLQPEGNRVIHLCKCDSDGERRGLMVDSADIPGLRRQANSLDNAGVFFGVEQALKRARHIRATRRSALERLDSAINRFATKAQPKMPGPIIGGLEIAPALEVSPA
jgi:hypothetical protein